MSTESSIKHETTQRISRLIRARYPLIAVVSHEENRVQDHVQKIAEEQGKTLYTWTVNQGVCQMFPEPEPSPEADDMAEATKDPVMALRQVLVNGEPTEDTPTGSKEVYLFKDLHAFLTGERQDPVVVRALRDVAATLVKRHQTVILLSPSFQTPTDAEKDVVVVDFPLPTSDELGRAVDQFIANLPNGIESELNGGREKVIRALQGLTAVEADAVLAQAVIAKGHLSDDAIPFILNAKAEIIRNSGALEYYPEQAGYDEIGGLDLLKEWCAESEVAFSDAAAEYGVEPDKGVLIVGVPGCGKSLTAKAIAGGNRPLLRLDVGALFGSLVGQSEQQTRNALKVAEAVAPCVLWVDEIEKSLGSGGGELDGGTSVRVLGTILTWMQETKAPVFVVATANDIGSLRPELIRRFSEVFFVDLPQNQERADILTIHMEKRGRKIGKTDTKKVVKATEGFTGSEIEKVVQGALRRAFADGEREVMVDDLLHQAEAMVPLATTMEKGINDMRSWAVRARPASSRQETGNKKAAEVQGRALEV
jgi:ATP-dependent 26S proteasome regulatory subunit